MTVLSNSKQKSKSINAPKVKIEGFSSKVVQNDSKIDYKAELRLNVISGIYGANKPSLFYKINNSKDFVTVKEGQIILSNLLSGDYSVVVYYHDGKSYSGVANFVFLKLLDLGIYLWMILLYVV
jgi:hypothetical protein